MPNAFQPFHSVLSHGCDLPSSYALRGVLCQGLVQSCCPCEASVHPCEMLLLRNTSGCSLQLPVVPGTAAGQSGFGGAVRQPWEAGLEQAAPACGELGHFPQNSRLPVLPKADCFCWSASLAEVMKCN